MKRTALKRTKPLTSRSRMRQVSAKRRAYRASKEGQDALEYMGKVRALPCVICHLHGLPQQSPTQVHHVIHRRFGNRKASDFDTLALCEGHHQGDFDTSKVALHREPDKWKELYGDDVDYLPAVRRMINPEEDE